MAVLAICAFAVVGSVVFASALWSLRGETSGDRPGERTCATFVAPVEPDPKALGERRGDELVRALCTALASRGTTTSTPWGNPRAPSWSFLAGDARVEVSIFREGKWDLVVVDPSSGGPGSIEVAAAIDIALRRVAGVERVRWHKRQHFLRRDRDHGSDSPVERRTPGYRG